MSRNFGRPERASYAHGTSFGWLESSPRAPSRNFPSSGRASYAQGPISDDPEVASYAYDAPFWRLLPSFIVWRLVRTMGRDRLTRMRRLFTVRNCLLRVRGSSGQSEIGPWTHDVVFFGPIFIPCALGPIPDGRFGPSYAYEVLVGGCLLTA